MRLPALIARRSRRATREWLWVSLLSLLIVAVLSLPYVLAYLVPPSHVFTGIVLNPADGNSYLAKMREGLGGAWLFTLPYTAAPGAGAFIFIYYLFLGHLARWTGASVDLVYHLARTAGGLCLLLMAYHFISRFFETRRERLAAWLLFSIGSGLGWLAALLGGFTSDLWVAEAIPFLSVLSNAHFALAAALMLCIFLWTLPGLETPSRRSEMASPSAPWLRSGGQGVGPTKGQTLCSAQGDMTSSPVRHAERSEAERSSKTLSEANGEASQGEAPLVSSGIGRLMWIALATTALAQVQPLALIPVGLVSGALTAWWNYARRRLIWPELFPVLIFGLSAAPWLIYDAAVSAAFPVLARWNAQNLTPSPPLWDALISGGAPLLLALPGLEVALQRRGPRDVALVFWFSLGALSLYAPFSLQRRLSIGLWMPLVILAAQGFREAIWPRLAGPGRRVLALAAIAVLSLPSNLLVYAAALGAIQARDPAVFLSQDEAAAIAWLGGAGSEPASGAIVLASPETGLFIPARSQARVIYGHPFETVDAGANRQAVEDFFAGRVDPELFVSEYSVDYVFYGPRERALGPPPALPGWYEVYHRGEVVVYGR